jgi:hypothetical protein
MSATIIPFKPKPTTEANPPRRWSPDFKQWYGLLGMTPRQAEMAHRLAFGDPERWRSTNAALHPFWAALDVVGPLIEGYREQLLKNMDARCPNAAKRIREGKPPKDHRRKNRRKKRAALRTAPAAG